MSLVEKLVRRQWSKQGELSVSRVLDGIRVLDFSRYLAGPYASMLLADMGAEVIRIEKPGGAEDREVGPFAPNGQALRNMVLARNKKDITLNLLARRGEELLAIAAAVLPKRFKGAILL